MTSLEIAEAAVALFNKRITNEIFLIIQNDRDLMHAYLREVEHKGLDSVNQTIGKYVKVKYNLTNAAREKKPSCTLIQSHQKFE